MRLREARAGSGGGGGEIPLLQALEAAAQGKDRRGLAEPGEPSKAGPGAEAAAEGGGPRSQGDPCRWRRPGGLTAGKQGVPG